MLAKYNRLTKREDFAIVYSKGAYSSLDGITIKYAHSKNIATRIGFSIGKNFSKKATQRNRARRVLQEACRLNIALLKPGLDIVVMIKPDCKDMDFKKTVEILKKIFTKANLFI